MAKSTPVKKSETGFQIHFKEDNDSVTIKFGPHVFEGLSMMEKMTAIDLLRENNKVVGKFIVTDDLTQTYWVENVDNYRESLKEQSKSFRDFRSLILDEVRGPLYVYPDRVCEIVKSLYSYQKGFDSVEPVNLAPIVSRVVRDNEQGKLVFDVKNLEVFDGYAKGVVIDWAATVISNLDYELSKKNNKKTVERIYGMSSSIMNYTYSPDVPGGREYLKHFSGKDSILHMFMLDGLRKEKSIEVSFNMIYTADEARKYKEYEDSLEAAKKDVGTSVKIK